MMTSEETLPMWISKGKGYRGMMKGGATHLAVAIETATRTF
jgi:hypothetical protein